MVETFEMLSTMGDMLASRVNRVSEQLGQSRENERILSANLKKAEARRKALEMELDKKTQLLRDLSGIPRKQVSNRENQARYFLRNLFVRATTEAQ